MLIDDHLIQFCVDKTREITKEHDDAWGDATKGDVCPRSADDLHIIMMGRHEKPIYHREFTKLHWAESKFRSIYIPFDDRIEIYYAAGLPPRHLRFYKTKELLQIHLWQESLATNDIIDLVQNMILRESPASIDLNLGHPATSDTLGEIAAMEYLFPFERRLAYKPEQNGVQHLAEVYAVPPFVIQRSLNILEPLKPFYV